MSETTLSQYISLEHSRINASIVGKSVAQTTHCHCTSQDIIRNKLLLKQIIEAYCFRGWGVDGPFRISEIYF